MLTASPPQRPLEYAEQSLATALLDGSYPPGSTLPAERELAERLGITRPTLREALRRLERDGWLRVHQGKPTVVTDFWREGGLNVLSALVRYSRQLPADFIPNLLAIRPALAPEYVRAAVERDADAVVARLEEYPSLPDTAEAFAAFDWSLHHLLTEGSGNPIYTLILNGFSGVYERVASFFFSYPEARAGSRSYYAALLAVARRGDAARAERLTRIAMRETIALWQKAGRPPKEGEL